MLDEHNIPIDIHLNKLLDWLVSRRICPQDWQRNILIVRKNINNAIQDMPANEEITQLLAGTYINYFHCIRIVEILKETEVSSKNIFGVYSSKRMKDWVEILKLYEKQDIYLAEAAQLLVRNIVYELPSLKRQFTKSIQSQEECLKKVQEYTKNEAAMRENYVASCQQIGIEGQNIKKELLSMLEDLPEALNCIARNCGSLRKSRELYVQFLAFTLKKDEDALCLPVLKYVMEKGNTSTFEWRTGEAPDVIENTSLVLPVDIENSSTETADNQIDFGDLAATSESGDDRSSSSPNGDFVHVEKDDCKGSEQIDFGETVINWDISVEEPVELGEGGKVARGLDALSILENDSTRDLFYADLLELEAFLDQRRLECSGSGALPLNLFQNASQVLQMQCPEHFETALKDVKDIIMQLTTPKLKLLLLIKGSPRYVDRLVDSLRSKLETAERMVECQKAVKARFQEAVEEQKALELKIQLIAEKTKVLLSQVESEISKRYKNRPVNIMGGLSALQQILAK